MQARQLSSVSTLLRQIQEGLRRQSLPRDGRLFEFSGVLRS